MLREWAIDFSDWRAKRLKAIAGRKLNWSMWWTEFAEFLETGHWPEQHDV